MSLVVCTNVSCSVLLVGILKRNKDKISGGGVVSNNISKYYVLE